LLCLLPGTISRLQAQTEADAIIEKQIKEYTLKPDGSIEFRQLKKVKLLTYNAIHKLYGETFLVYNSNYQTLKVLDCFTTMKNGNKVVTPPNAFNEVLPRFAANAPVYNKLKEMVVTHTGLEIGATITLDYQLNSNPDFAPGLFASEVLTETSPIKDMEIIVRVPIGTYLYYDINALIVRPSIKEVGKIKEYHWQFKDLPMHLNEPNQPPSLEVLPSLFFSSIRDHEQLSNWFTSQAAFSFEANDQMKAFVHKIEKEADGELQSALKLQEAVVNDFLYFGVPATTAALNTRSAPEVWASGGGTALEKAVLLYSLLKAADITCGVFAVVPTMYLMSFANPASWEDFVVEVKLKDKSTMFLSIHELNGSNLFTKLQRKQFLALPQMDVLLENKGNTALNQAVLSAVLRLNTNNEIQGDFDLQLSGACVPDLAMARSTQKAGYYIGGIAGASFKEVRYNEKTPTSCGLRVSLDKAITLEKKDDYLFLGLPYPEAGLESWHLGELPLLRNGMFELPFPLYEVVKLEISIPEKTELISPGNEKKLVNVAGSLTIRVEKQDGKIILTNEIMLNNNFTEPGYYKAMRELVNIWMSKAYKEVILKTR